MSNKISIIGNGQIAKAIAFGLLGNYELEIIGRNMSRLGQFCETLGITIYNKLENFDPENKNIILCVKPNQLETVSATLKKKTKVPTNSFLY